jgi:DUF1680 family protein
MTIIPILRSLIAAAFILATLLPATAATGLQVKVKSFPVSSVRLGDSPFKHAQEMNKCYLLALDADRLAAPYLKGAGLTPKASNYPNWENSGLDGHTGGHYLSALSFMYASTGDARIKERLDYMLAELKRAQDASPRGYLCGTPGGETMWNEIAAGNIQARPFELNNHWVPLYNIHKTYAGLRDAYLHAGCETAKDMLVRLTDWMINIVSQLSDEQMQDILRSEHGGLNEVFADVAHITSNRQYLQLAKRFSHQAILQPLLNREDNLTGLHANTQIPKVIGFKRIADIEGNNNWNNAAQFFWHTVVNNRSVSIGGNSVREHFHPAGNFSEMMHSEQGPETCNTYNMLRLTKLLYQTSGNAQYVDYYERALYNHILSTQNPIQGGFVYFTPIRPGHYRVYSQPQTSFWCCVGSGLENHSRYGEMIYGYNETNLYVNLFIPSTLDWQQQNITITQTNSFPLEESTAIKVSTRAAKEFTLNLRAPLWTTPAGIRLTINSTPWPVQIQNGYIEIKRTWRDGDSIRLSLPMRLQALPMPDLSANYSFMYGPIVLAAKTGTDNQAGIFADDSRGGHIAHGPRLPLAEMPTIIGSTDSILNYLTKDNRKPINFTLGANIYPERFRNLNLQPFYLIHESRYTIYFPIVSHNQFKEQQEKNAQADSLRTALANITVDHVICGEQQPENDHYIQQDNSNAGLDNETGQHWRNARGWFSYKMQTKNSATHLYINYHPDSIRTAAIYINNREAATIPATPTSGSIVIPIPGNLRQAEYLDIRIGKGKSHATPLIYEIRLTNSPPIR